MGGKSNRLAFLIEFQEHLISGKACTIPGLGWWLRGKQLRLIYENLLNEVFAPICLRNYHYERSANMTEQQRRERVRERERAGQFWLFLLLEMFLHVVGIYTTWAGDEQMANCWFSLSEMPVMCSVSCRSIRHAPELWTLSNGHTLAGLPVPFNFTSMCMQRYAEFTSLSLSLLTLSLLS